VTKIKPSDWPKSLFCLNSKVLDFGYKARAADQYSIFINTITKMASRSATPIVSEDIQSRGSIAPLESSLLSAFSRIMAP
jgi:hypothetical protein